MISAAAEQEAREVPLDPEVAALLAAALGSVQEVAKAAEVHNAPEVARAAQELREIQSNLAPVASAAAKNSPAPYAEPRVQRGLAAVARVLQPRQESVAHQVAQDPTDDEKKEELKKATDNLSNELENIRDVLTGASERHRKPEDALLDELVEIAKDTANRVEEAATSSPHTVPQATKDAQEALDKLAPVAQEAALKSTVPGAEEAVELALGALANTLLPRQGELSKSVAQTPQGND